MGRKVHILGTSCKLLKRFCAIVFEQKFNKVLNLGEEDPLLRIRLCDLN